MKLISFVVIGRNEARHLEDCLESVVAVYLPSGWRRELIYVDAASRDNSVVLARSFGARIVELANSNATAGEARNLGLKSAAGDWVIVMDGNTELNAAFLLRASGQMQPHTAAIVGRHREKYPQASIYNRFFDVQHEQPALLCSGGGALLRRSAALDCGAYDATLQAGEEPDLYRRLIMAGWDIDMVSDCLTLHDLAMTRLSQFCRRSIRTGYAWAELAYRTRSSAWPLWVRESRLNIGYSLLLSALLLLAALSPLCVWAGLSALLGLGAALLHALWRLRPRAIPLSQLLGCAICSLLQPVVQSWGQILYCVDKWNAHRRRMQSRLLQW